MVFSSIEFMYVFLPLTILVYFIVPKRFKNICLLLFSLVFYAFGEPVYIVLMLFSSVVDFVNGLLVERYQGRVLSKVFLIISILINIGLLAVFKYYGLIIEGVNGLFGLELVAHDLPLPIGISFYTFQTMSYTIDVYRGNTRAQRNFLNFATYVSLFPQLIAGPIVRYVDIQRQLENRTTTLKSFSDGVVRFTYGLGKKVLIANNIGLIASQVLDGELTMMSIWMYAFSFGMQIYFDFSGYSDMAIGLGKMFGFEFKENFNYPYISKSITEFWRRWHMSLGAWFRDYVYIPLGGNRKGMLRFIINILIVWGITGLWHGAEVNFILWGLYFGLILLVEKLVLLKYLEGKTVLSHIYVGVFVAISWLIFTATSFAEFAMRIKGMVGIGVDIFTKRDIFMLQEGLVIFMIAVLFSTPIFRKVKYKDWYKKLEPVIMFLILLSSTAFIVDSSFNPFLYFRF